MCQCENEKNIKKAMEVFDTIPFNELTQKRAFYRLNVDFGRIDMVVKRLNELAMLGSMVPNQMKVLFITQSYVDKLKSYVRKIPLSDLSKKVYTLLNRRVYNQMLVVTESDFPDEKMWQYVMDFMVVFLPGTGNKFGMEGYGSRGLDIITFSTWLINDDNKNDIINTETGSADFFGTDHNCDDWPFEYGFDNTGGFEKGTDIRNGMGFKAESDWKSECPRCGMKFYFASIPPEQIWEMHNKYIERM